MKTSKLTKSIMVVVTVAALAVPGVSHAQESVAPCMAAYWVSPQPVDATHALNRSTGVSKPNVLRSRSFN